VGNRGTVRSEEVDGNWDRGVAARETQGPLGVLDIVLVERG
jgi:hypothetical protein